MRSIKYDKLVRDKIPEKIINAGKVPHTIFADDQTYHLKLKEKLHEEVKEFSESENLEELADIIEVIHALVKQKGESIDKLYNIKDAKREKRGGFDQKIILKQVDENGKK